MKTPRPPSEYQKIYEREVRRLKGCVERYDKGDDPENAIRDMANSIRQLLKSSRSTTSILDHVGRGSIKFLDTSPTWQPKGLLAEDGFLAKDLQGHYLAKLDSVPADDLRWVPLDEWWKRVIFSTPEGLKITRSDLVLTLTEQDGGTHTDAGIETEYYALTRLNILGWKFGSGRLSLEFRSPLAAAMRQIAHELLRSLDDSYRKIPTNEPNIQVSGIQMVMGKHEIHPMFFVPSKTRGGMTCIRNGAPVRSNDPCHCGSGKKLKRCHGHKAQAK